MCLAFSCGFLSNPDVLHLQLQLWEIKSKRPSLKVAGGCAVLAVVEIIFRLTRELAEQIQALQWQHDDDDDDDDDNAVECVVIC